MKPLAPFGVIALMVASTISTAAEPKVETVLDGLTNPCGVVVQAGTGHVFVSDSGAGRVIRLVDGKPEDVVTGFPTETYGTGHKYDIGPLGLAFTDKVTLLVGGGGQKNDKEVIRVFTIPEPGKAALAVDGMKTQIGPLLPASDDLSAAGDFFGIVTTPGGVYVTCNGDDEKGWIARARRNDGGTKFEPLERFIAAKEKSGAGAPVAMTLGPRGELVVGSLGKTGKERDSVLSFYNANSGRPLLSLASGLYDITAVAYSPKTKLLYAIDFAWSAPEEGGLYRLDAAFSDGKQSVKAVKIVPVTRGAAMAFAADGTLYIAAFGDAKESEKKPPGKLLKIAPGL